MLVEYFIQDEATHAFSGPFDLLSLSQRIRRGTVIADTVLSRDPEVEAFRAIDVPELQEVFRELAVRPSEETRQAPIDEPFGRVLREGYRTFGEQQVTAVMTGVFLVAAFFGVMLLSMIPSLLISRGLMACWLQLCLSVYGVCLLRKSRLQPLHSDFRRMLARHHLPKLLLLSLVIGFVPFILPAILSAFVGSLAWLLTVFPGSLVFAWFVYAPFLMVDHDAGVREALTRNQTGMRRVGFGVYATVFLLVILNVIVPIPPVMLPITYLALCAIYERNFGEI